MTDAPDSLILREERGDVILLTLNRPSSLNSLTPGLIDELATHVADAENSAHIRVIMITGAGRGFCAGQDLALVGGSSGAPIDAALIRSYLDDHYLPLARMLHRGRCLVIAAVNGVAAGAGFSLALAADIRLAAPEAQFIQAFARIGLVPDAGGSYFLSRIIGPARACEMSLRALPIPAAEAHALGIVSEIVPAEALLDRAWELGEELARGPLSLEYIKELFLDAGTADFETQLTLESALQEKAALSDDFREGVHAFLQKRHAAFHHR